MRGLKQREKTRSKGWLLAPVTAGAGAMIGFANQSAHADIIDLQYLASGGSAQGGFTTVSIGANGFSSPLTDTYSITAPGVGSANSVTVTATSTSGTLLPRNRTAYTGSFSGLYNSIMFANSGTTTFGLNVSGLITGDKYKLTLYGADGNTSGTETFKDSSNALNTTSESWTPTSPTSLTQYSGTLTLTASSGAIGVNITNSADSGQALLNGFSLSYIQSGPTISLTAPGNTPAGVGSQIQSSFSSSNPYGTYLPNGTNTLEVHGSHNLYTPGFIKNLNTAGGGLGTAAGYTTVSGFNPSTDQEIYLLHLDVNGSNATASQAATIASDITSENITGLTVTADPASPFNKLDGTDPQNDPNGWTLELAYNMASQSNLANGSFGFNFSGYTDGSIANVTVTDVAVVPEPTAMGLLTIVAGSLAMRRRTHPKNNG